MKLRGHTHVCVGAITATAALLAFGSAAGASALTIANPVPSVQPDAEYAGNAAARVASNLSAGESGVSASAAAASVAVGAPKAPSPVNVASDVAEVTRAAADVAPAPQADADAASVVRATRDAAPAAQMGADNAAVPAPDPSVAAVRASDRTRSAAPAVASSAKTAAVPRPSPTANEGARGAGSSSPGADPVPSAAHAASGASIDGSRLSLSDAALAKAVSLPVRQILADIEGGSWPTSIPDAASSAEPSLGAELAALMRAIEGSVSGVEPGGVVLPSPSADPAFARSRSAGPRAAPEMGLPGATQASPTAFVADDRSFQRGAWRSAGEIRGLLSPGSSLEANGPEVPSSAPRTSAGAVPAIALSQGGRRVARRPAAPPGPHGGAGAGEAVTVGGAPPISASLPASAAASGASGGIAAGAATALLAMAALWLLQALLPGRLALDLLPWQSTMLALRLERPG